MKPTSMVYTKQPGCANASASDTNSGHDQPLKRLMQLSRWGNEGCLDSAGAHNRQPLGKDG
jgi:hypothetical protein